MKAVPLSDAHEEHLFGGKAVSLGAAIRAGLPVPPGLALAAPLVDAIAAGSDAAVNVVLGNQHVPHGHMAVRSSAVGEDSGTASFAGQHATKLNVTRRELVEAVRFVWQSGRSESALAYRERQGIAAAPQVGVVVQLLVDPMAAGVLFTRNPITGEDERVIEAAWGLGEIVVSSRVVPDFYRLSATGAVLEQRAGDKDVQIVRDEQGGIREIPVDNHLRRMPSLRTRHLQRLHALADRAQKVWGHPVDLEFAFTGDDALYLLQSRPITAGRLQPA
jgi:pyruvate, water dikinase